MLRICLFGSLSVAHGEGGSGARSLAGRCGSLLAYLALGHGRYFSRSELQSSLWSERSASSSPGSFNTALWRLRRLVETPPLKPGDLIVCDRRGAIGLNGPAGVWLDVEEFERLVTPGLEKPPERLTDADIDGLRRGVELYTSDILLDLSDDWALREREKHRRNHLNALGRLMQLATIRRDHAEAIRHGQAILDHDALREDVHRELMQLFVLSGQRAQALQQFEACRELLRRELAIQPMRETMAVYRQIAESAIAPSRALPPSMPPAAPSMPPVPTQAPSPSDMAGEASQRPLVGPPHACELIDAARKQLAAADAQLQLSLRLMRQ